MSYSKYCALLLALLGQRAIAHSWIEQLSNVALDGSYTSSFGYPRGFVDKGAIDFDQNANVWLIPNQAAFVSEEDLLCHPSQRAFRQSPGYPRLKTMPGAVVAMRYAENGHVTIPGSGRDLYGKPKRGGTVFVFGTAQPRAEEVLLSVLEWTRDGQGGDRRGRLLASENFDDGRCYQLGNGAELANSRKMKTPNPVPGQPGTSTELLCETDVKLPAETPLENPYTLYWVWQWPTAPGKDPHQLLGRDEYYTSCVDIDVVRSISPLQTNSPLLQQDPIPSAVVDFASRSALTTDPLALYSERAAHKPSETAS